MLPFLFLLLSLNLQLVLRVLDVPSKAVAVEVVVTGCFGKGLVLLETIEADDALAMGDVVICENFLPFLRGEKTLLKQRQRRELGARPVY